MIDTYNIKDASILEPGVDMGLFFSRRKPTDTDMVMVWSYSSEIQFTPQLMIIAMGCTTKDFIEKLVNISPHVYIEWIRAMNSLKEREKRQRELNITPSSDIREIAWYTKFKCYYYGVLMDYNRPVCDYLWYLNDTDVINPSTVPVIELVLKESEIIQSSYDNPVDSLREINNQIMGINTGLQNIISEYCNVFQIPVVSNSADLSFDKEKINMDKNRISGCTCPNPEYVVDEKESQKTCMICGYTDYDGLTYVNQNTRIDEVTWGEHHKISGIQPKRPYAKEEHFIRTLSSSGKKRGVNDIYTKMTDRVLVHYKSIYSNDPCFIHANPYRIKICMMRAGIKNFNVKYIILANIKNMCPDPLIRSHYQETTQEQRDSLKMHYKALEKTWDALIEEEKKKESPFLSKNKNRKKEDPNFLNYELSLFVLVRYLGVKNIGIYWHPKRMKTRDSRERQEYLLSEAFARNGWDLPYLGNLNHSDDGAIPIEEGDDMSTDEEAMEEDNMK